MALTAKEFTTDASPQGQARLDQAASGGRPLKFGERSDGVQALQKALIDAGESIPDGATGFFGDETRNAVTSFQRKNVAVHGPPDGEAGPITLRLLNTQLGGDDPGPKPPIPPKPPVPPPTPKTPTDFVIFFDGGGPGVRLGEDEVLDISNLPSDYSTKHAMVRLGYRTGLIDSADTQKTMAEFKDKVQASQSGGSLGRIYVYGASGGGRVALNFVKQLNGIQAKVRYLGVTDPAFFMDGLCTNRPDGLFDNLPIFVNSGTAADIKHNFYQKLGNRVRPDKEILSFKLKFVWFSTMRNNEIHGKIQDFTNPDQDLTIDVNRKLRPRSINPDLDFHEKCNEIAIETKLRPFILRDLGSG